MSNLIVKVTKRTTNGNSSWEGTANLPGVRPTKIVKSKTSESTFTTRSALTGAAQRLAVRYGFNDVKFEGESEPTSTKTKKTSSKKTTLV
jgi:hypothetical protein